MLLLLLLLLLVRWADTRLSRPADSPPYLPCRLPLPHHLGIIYHPQWRITH